MTDLPGLVAQAPADAHLVVCHTLVLYQVAAGERERFAATVRGLNATWLCSEAPGILPGTGHAGSDGLLSVIASTAAPSVTPTVTAPGWSGCEDV